MVFRAVKKMLGAGVKLVVGTMIVGSALCALGSFVPKTINAIKDGINFDDYVCSLFSSTHDKDFTNAEDIEQMAGEVSDTSYAFAEENNLEFEKVSLSRVVDGDTIVVDIYGDNCGDKSHEYSVRLIGVNTPESVASEEYLEYKGTTNSEEGKAASDFLKEYLSDVQYVYLEKDVSEIDRYDRLLRYVWTEIPSDKYNMDEVEKYMVNAMLVDKGYAEVATYQPDTKYSEYFEAIEAGTTDDFEIDR